jgi:hypothetical protein
MLLVIVIGIFDKIKKFSVYMQTQRGAGSQLQNTIFIINKIAFPD